MGSAATMKAVRLHGRGGLETLVYEEAPIPKPRPAEVLIRVEATGISAAELGWPDTWTSEDGERSLPIPGHELCGTIEAVGACIVAPQVGDEVYGLTDFGRDGAEAEYAIALPREIAPKPKSLTPAQAAAVPIAGLTAWQAFFEHAALAPGMRVLIHGASGGVGSLAVQIARWAGAHVIATTSARNETLVRGFGAEVVIDHDATRFEDVVKDVDVVFDAVGGRTLERSWPVLAKGGTLLSIVEPPSRSEANRYGVRAKFFIVRPDREQLVRIGRLIDEGHFRPFVDAVMPLAEVRSAYEHRRGPHPVGRTVLCVEHAS